VADLARVQPGDLITAELINAIIDSLQAIDAKTDECLKRINPPPSAPAAPFIKLIDPPQAEAGQIIDIRGGGFLASLKDNEVAIGGLPVTTFGKVTTSLIQAMVPNLGVAEGTRVPVVVKNKNGAAKTELVVGRRPPDVVFVPTPPEVVAGMLKLAGVNEADLVYDLGSGDGRIVIMAAEKFGAGGVGIDIDPQRINEAEMLAKKANVTDRVKFILGDFFQANLSEATVIALHLLPSLNLKLRPTLEKLRAGTRVVSHQFDMGDWQPDFKMTVTLPDRDHEVYLWTIGR
jgi:Methyltransferase domain/IPT/TIG domain